MVMVQRARYLHDDEHGFVDWKLTVPHVYRAVARNHLGKERKPGSLLVGVKKLAGVMGASILLPVQGY